MSAVRMLAATAARFTGTLRVIDEIAPSPTLIAFLAKESNPNRFA